MVTASALVRLFFSTWGAKKTALTEHLVGSMSADAFLVKMKHRYHPMSTAQNAHRMAKEIISEGIHQSFDSYEALCQAGLVGTVYQHWNNKKFYVLVDFVWDSELDVWKLLYERLNPDEAEQQFIRSFENAFGDVLQGSMPVKRFEQFLGGSVG